MRFYLQAVNGVPLILDAERRRFHVPSFLADLIPYGATMTDAEFAAHLEAEQIEWHPVPAYARFAPEPIAEATNSYETIKRD